MVIVSSVASHEHAKAAHDVRHAKVEAARVELHGRVNVGHTENDVVDLLGACALVPLAMTIPAHHAGKTVFILRGIDTERFARECPKADANPRVIATVDGSIRINAHSAVALQIARHRLDRGL